jgi:inosine-uridine nucleoside N-ribohydrolase
MSSGFEISELLLDELDSYMTAATCLNQSANIFLQPSPFGAIELIKLTLKYSKIPVDILVLGPMTNLATAISEDRSIVSKIGTVYFSGKDI